MNSIRRFFGRCIVLIGTFFVCYGILGIVACLSWSDYEMIPYGFLCVLGGFFPVLGGRKLLLSGKPKYTPKKFFGGCIFVIGISAFGSSVAGNLDAFEWCDYEFVPEFSSIGIIGIILVVVGIKQFLSKKTAYVPKKPKQKTSAETVVPLSEPPKPPEPPEPPAAPTKMVCPSCGKEYPLDYVYCDECGSRLKET